MSPKDADGIANSVDPDQTAPLGAVWSGSALFAQTYLSENLGSLRYFDGKHVMMYLHFFLRDHIAVKNLQTWTPVHDKWSVVKSTENELKTWMTGNLLLQSWEPRLYSYQKWLLVAFFYFLFFLLSTIVVQAEEQIRTVFDDNWRIIFVSSP